MKAFKRVFALLITLVFLTGCTMQEKLVLSISKDKNVKVSIIMAMDNEMIDGMLSMGDNLLSEDSSDTKTYTDEERWEYLEGDNSSISMPEGYEVKRYEKDNFKGFIATKELGSIDQITASSSTERVNIMSESEDNDTKFLEGKLFIKDGNKYKSNMTIDLGESSSQIDSYKEYGATFNIELSIELPEKSKSNNATKVSEDGKTLTYNLLESKDIDFEFNFDSSSNSSSSKTLYIVIGVCVLLVIVVLAVLKLSSKKTKSEEN